ncbi:hypothetical protein ACN47E_001265 [Coniothyrium glycines]
MEGTAMQDFIPVIMELSQHPPDPNGPRPLANHRGFAIGVTMPFLALSLVAVALRLHTRVRIVRQPGWDDVFVAIAAVLNVAAQVAFAGGLTHGLGQHLISVLGILPTTMKWFYVANAAYTSTTVFVKLSLLSQYLRMFRGSYRRISTISLLVLVVVWGTAFCFLAWFPCVPIRGFWDKMMIPPAKCYGFGYRTAHEARLTLLAFAGSNMCLDVLVFLLPFTEYFRSDLGRKELIAMTGLLAMGSIAVIMALLRLWSGLKNNGSALLLFDFTYWLPEVIVFSCLEVDFAIMCASMPIFWPTIKAAWSRIYITNEVIVTHETCDMANTSDLEMDTDRATSLKRQQSTDGLIKKTMLGGSSYLDTEPEPRIVPILPAPKMPRVSWGGPSTNRRL